LMWFNSWRMSARASRKRSLSLRVLPARLHDFRALRR
jgi:hypothetical protein